MRKTERDNLKIHKQFNTRQSVKCREREADGSNSERKEGDYDLSWFC